MTYPKIGSVLLTLEDVEENDVELDWPTLVTIGCSKCRRSAVRAVRVLNTAEWWTMRVPTLPAGSWIFEAGRPVPTNREVGIQIGTDDPFGFDQTVHLIRDDGTAEALGLFSVGIMSPKGRCPKCNRLICFSASELRLNEGKRLWKATGD